MGLGVPDWPSKSMTDTITRTRYPGIEVGIKSDPRESPYGRRVDMYIARTCCPPLLKMIQTSPKAGSFLF